jgi:enoyl-CoA hydratase/carnithine racemase
MSDYIKLYQQEGVLEILFARQDKKNALTNAMYRKACEALESAQTNPSIRVVLFGSESDIFTAGNDLGDLAEAAQSSSDELQAHAFIQALGRAKKPIVTAVPGIAVGIGTTMLLHSDMVFVAETARLSAPFVNLALVPEAGSSMLMPARIGYVRAFELFALGGSISGAEAVALGLANRVLPAEDVLPTARSAALSLSKKPMGSLLATKKLMRDSETVLRSIGKETVIFGERLMSEEAREAFAAFAEHRQPDFTKFVI